ncbi:MAG: ASKHA domain-containing protein, partial [Acidobacteriota bacterium]
HGEDLGLSMHPRGLVYIFPNVGAYFGGDLIAGILASGLHRSESVGVLLDVGTNAELVVGNRDWMLGCAGSAGPALEGGVIRRGMIAAPGAIDRVRIDPLTFEPSFRVIGDEKPTGLCGSGIIDLVAEMFQAGLLTIQGRINTTVETSWIVETPDRTPAYLLARGNETAHGEDILVTETEIGIFLKSKAAMYTILTVIVGRVGLNFSDIERFHVAGAFGNHIDPAMAVRIGMIPDLPLSIYQGLGNTSGTGAAMALLDRSLLDEAERVRNTVTYIELNVDMELMNEFQGALFIPHTNPRLFPSVTIPERALAAC